MSRYADLDALEKALNARLTFLRERNGNYDPYADGFDEAVDRVENFPTADVAPVMHTRWAHLGGDEWCCPVCGFVISTEGSWDKPVKKYCEDCGAKMDGGDGNGAD